ncbi:MAG: S8 family serine peptidase [Thermoleophilia bacterium]|nr:S8 family serine peptidase [Thermoleophilia bacterium]
MRRGLILLVLLAVLAPAAAARAATVDVVVTLEQPSLARAVSQSRALSTTARRQRLSLRSPTSVAHLEALANAQDAVARRIERAVPGATVRWRYRIVLNGLAVAVPEERLGALARVRGVVGVLRSTRYSAATGGAGSAAVPAAASAVLAGDGDGIKIAILDDGLDQRHPFFDPAGYAYPAGFPKGNTAFTTRKVIAARAFPPRTPRWRNASLPFDPQLSGHGTHVAGIAAGNANTPAVGRGTTVSGVAPRAYLGNYKVLTTPTAAGLGLNGNSPEIAAGIEAAVADGMDVINLSLGEPEVEPTRDLVTRAVDGAVDAGVVVAIAAGNDGDVHGSGSVGSPASAAKAITVAALATRTLVASFSSTGPTPLSLRMKPELAAPGVDVLSSVPSRQGLWARFSGTSMAAPHVAGYAALLLERHPTWTPQQVKSALVQSAVPIAAPAVRAGSGVGDPARAAEPLLFADPASISFGLIARDAIAGQRATLADAGGGAGVWSVTVDDPSVVAPPTVTVPGTLELAATGGEPGTRMGHVSLTRDGQVRRIPYWFRVSAPQLGRHRTTPLPRPGVYAGNTAGKPSLVERYRYPEQGSSFPGPEQVFRVRLARPVANFGVVVLTRGRGVRVEPRITEAGNEDRLLGYASLPFNLNPYQASFGAFKPAAGALLPRAGSYDVVFDTVRRSDAGRFTFRFWVDDTKPPALRPVARAVRRGAPLRIRAADSGGSGIDPASLDATIGGRARTARLRGGVVSVDTSGLRVGTHRLVLRVSDYQETRNNENVSRILPNTRTLSFSFRVTR